MGTFTAFMFIGTLKHSRSTQVIFGSLAILFFLLALGDFTGITIITRIAGAVGVFTGFSAFYGAMGQIINGEFNKKIFSTISKYILTNKRLSQESFFISYKLI